MRTTIIKNFPNLNDKSAISYMLIPGVKIFLLIFAEITLRNLIFKLNLRVPLCYFQKYNAFYKNFLQEERYCSFIGKKKSGKKKNSFFRI